MMQDQMMTLSDDQLFKMMGAATPGSQAHGSAAAEVQRRQMIAQGQAIAAQIQAAKYALWTVVIAGLSTVITAIGIGLNAFSHH